MSEILGEALEMDLGSAALIVERPGDPTLETVPNYAALLTSTADRVRVLDMADSLYGFEGACDFYKSDLRWESGTKTHLSSFAHRMSDGAVMLACPDQQSAPPPNAPVCALGDCIASYVRPATWAGHEDETLTYGAKGLFYGTANTYLPWDAARTYGSGEYFIDSGTVYRTKVQVQGVEPPNAEYYEPCLSKNLIDCSGFVSAVLQGITFSNSRYVLGAEAENVRGGYVGGNYMTEATFLTGNNHGGMVTSQLVEWFAEQKRLFRLRTDGDDQDAVNQLCFGDVLFSGDPNDSKYDNRAYHIDHVVMVLRTYADGYVLAAQGGGRGVGFDGAVGHFQAAGEFEGHVPTCKLTLLDLKGRIGEGKTYRVFARPNYGGLSETARSLPITINNDASAETKTIGGEPMRMFSWIFCGETLQPGACCTLLLRGELPYGAENHLAVRLLQGGNAVGLAARLKQLDFSGGEAVIPFVVPASFHGANELGIYVCGESDAPFSVSEAALVRGFAETAEVTRALSIPSAASMTDLLDRLEQDVLAEIPSFESRRGRMVVAVANVRQTIDWKVSRRAAARYVIAVIGAGGAGAVRESVNGTASDTIYTAADPVPLHEIY